MEEGNEGMKNLCDIMNIPISDQSTRQLTKHDAKRNKLKQRRTSEGKERFYRRLREAMLNRADSSSSSSYAPGICDAGAGPSADMPYCGTEQNDDSDDVEDFAENCFVVNYTFSSPIWMVCWSCD